MQHPLEVLIEPSSPFAEEKHFLQAQCSAAPHDAQSPEGVSVASNNSIYVFLRFFLLLLFLKMWLTAWHVLVSLQMSRTVDETKDEEYASLFKQFQAVEERTARLAA